MTNRMPGNAASEWRQHWPVVIAAMAGVAMSTINVYSLGLFIQPLEQEFGWSRAEIAAGPLLPAIVTVLVGPFCGAAIDRFGPRRIGIAGVMLVACATALLGLTGPDIRSWWAVWVLLALINATLQPSIWTAGVAGFFSAGRGLAFAATLCGSGIGSLISPPLTYALIEWLGWRLAYLGIALIWGVLVTPTVVLLFTSTRDRDRLGPESLIVRTRSPMREGIADLLKLKFVQLALAGFLIAAVVVPFATSLVPILSSAGMARGEAAEITGLLGLSAIAGRLVIGYLLDRVEGRFLAAASLSLPVASSLLLLLFPGSTIAASAAVLILGAALGAELDIVAYLTTRYFGLARFGLMFGTIAGLITLAGGLGPWVISIVYDYSHSYYEALVAFIPMCLVSATLFLFLGKYPSPVSIIEREIVARTVQKGV